MMQENPSGLHNEWFRSWFDSPYYHVLYSHRDDAEARLFLDHLGSYLALPENASILDLACGKGRHSVYLNSKGYDVHGIDLSPESIQFAKQFENLALHFDVKDMRTFELEKKFECILNLFTSFGYFQMEQENVAVLERIKLHLKPRGIFVLDYFNTQAICSKMCPVYQYTLSGIHFDIRKSIQDGLIVKEITVRDGEKVEHFEERVQLLSFEVMQQMLAQVGLNFLIAFGDYELNPFHPESSDRMIIIARN